MHLLDSNGKQVIEQTALSAAQKNVNFLMANKVHAAYAGATGYNQAFEKGGGTVGYTYTSSLTLAPVAINFVFKSLFRIYPAFV